MGSAARAYSGELGGLEPIPLSQHPAYLAWVVAIRRRFNTPSVFPSGPHKGKLAERYKDRQGAFRYALPPMAVRAAEAQVLNREALDRRKGKLAEIRDVVRGPSPVDAYKAGAAWGDRVYVDVRDAASEIRKDVAGVPRKAISELLGIPEWVIPIAAIGTGLILLSGLYDRVRD